MKSRLMINKMLAMSVFLKKTRLWPEGGIEVVNF